MKTIVTLSLTIALLLTFSGCSNTVPNTENESKSNKTEYHSLSAKEAKKMLDEDDSITLLDVRTEEEFNEKHITGAILIPDYEIADRAEEELPDKDAVILIYCRSGNRSRSAAKQLVEMGYSNVYDFGGINNYPYDNVTE